MECHHIVQEAEGGPDTSENCIPVCFDCHADMCSYDFKHPKGTKYTPEELRRHRDRWYEKVAAGGGLEPRIVMEKRFLDLRFTWPHPAGLNGGPVFLARTHWQDKAPSAPLFSLQNFGQAPALDVTVVFELDDDSADFSVPSEWQACGLSFWQNPTADGTGVPSLMYRNPEGAGAGVPLYRRWAYELPNLLPGSPRTVELPQCIANRLLLRGIQLGCLVGPGKNCELALWARIVCHSMDGEKHGATFRWGMRPFSYRPAKPIEVYCHCRELPLRGGARELPVV
jgi:hypothetical protein